MNFINKDSNKLEILLDSLIRDEEDQIYDLFIATCYFRKEACIDLIDRLRNRIDLGHIGIYLDRKTAIQAGRDELADLKSKYSNQIDIFAIRSERLFHTKGYCLVPQSLEGVYNSGRLVIGSANLTAQGLTKQSGNIESALTTSNIEEILRFIGFFKNPQNLISIKDTLVFDDKEDLPYLKYALLLGGWFSHRWAGNLNRLFTKRYYLNETGRNRASGTIRTIGFNIRAASIGKTYFEFNLDEVRSIKRNLFMNYGIECSIGDWIPKGVIASSKKGESSLEDFRNLLRSRLDEVRTIVTNEIRRDFEQLVAGGDNLRTKERSGRQFLG